MPRETSLFGLNSVAPIPAIHSSPVQGQIPFEGPITSRCSQRTLNEPENASTEIKLIAELTYSTYTYLTRIILKSMCLYASMPMLSFILL